MNDTTESGALGGVSDTGVHALPTNGVQLIALERARQCIAEGYGPEHDDGHVRGEMVGAAICYAALAHAQALDVLRSRPSEMSPPMLPHLSWPWEAVWWKPSDDQVRNLVKAGALIAAELDRLLRNAELRTQNAESGKGDGAPGGGALPAEPPKRTVLKVYGTQEGGESLTAKYANHAKAERNDMGIITNQNIAVVKNIGRGLDIENYDSEMDVVLKLMNSGSIGGSYYGGPEHIKALEKIEAHLGKVRNQIAEHLKSEDD